MKSEHIAVRFAFLTGLFLFLIGPAHAEEKIFNGGFEEDCAAATQVCYPWMFTGNSAVNDAPHTGNYGATVGGLGDGGGTVKETITVKAGKYDFSFWYSALSGYAGNTPVTVTVAGKTVFEDAGLHTNPAYRFVSGTVTIDKASAIDVVFVASDSTNGYAGPLFNIDDVSMMKRQVVWTDTTQKGDWMDHDVTVTSGPFPQYGTKGHRLCDDRHEGSVAVCYADSCTYKDIKYINIFTPQDGKSPGEVYICGAAVER
jgi:hypothetical protein